MLLGIILTISGITLTAWTIKAISNFSLFKIFPCKRSTNEIFFISVGIILFLSGSLIIFKNL